MVAVLLILIARNRINTHGTECDMPIEKLPPPFTFAEDGLLDINRASKRYLFLATSGRNI